MLFYTLILIPIFTLSIFLSMSSHSWMMIWIGMEINLIVFIMLNLMKKNTFFLESSMKYFLIQSSGSLILLFSVSMNTLMYEDWPQIYMYSTPLAMLMKSGMAPLHSWSPQIISKMSNISILLFLTMQKIIPLTICFCSWMEILMFSALLNVFVGSMGGITQSSLLKMMIFSSINNSGWMIMSLTKSFLMFMLYFIIYMMLTVLIFMIIYSNQIKWMQQVTNIKMQDKMLMYSLFFSLSGLPPFLGFSTKWMVLNYMHIYTPGFTLIFIVLSLFTMFFYLKSCMTSLFLINLNNKWKMKLESFYSFNTLFLVMNFLGLPLFFILT